MRAGHGPTKAPFRSQPAGHWHPCSSLLTVQAGYREGITDGKLATLQEGFDTSFAASVPASRRLGALRGRANALLSIVSAPPAARGTRAGSGSGSTSAGAAAGGAGGVDPSLVEQVRALVSDLSRVRRDDVLPIDTERIDHERDEHGDDNAFELESNPQRDMEGLEDALGRMGGGAAANGSTANGALREEALLTSLESRVDALENLVIGGHA